MATDDLVNSRIQVISKHGIDLDFPEYSALSIRRVKLHVIIVFVVVIFLFNLSNYILEQYCLAWYRFIEDGKYHDGKPVFFHLLYGTL